MHNDPYWLDPKDPHRSPAVRQGVLGPTQTWFYVSNPAYAQVDAEHVFAVAESDVINGMTPDQATDKAFARIEDIFSQVSDQPPGLSGAMDGISIGIALAPGAAMARRRVQRGDFWRGGLQGSDTNWAIAFLVPYLAVFLLFVVYPVGYGLWLGHHPASYRAAVRRSDLSAHRWSTR